MPFEFVDTSSAVAVVCHLFEPSHLMRDKGKTLPSPTLEINLGMKPFTINIIWTGIICTRLVANLAKVIVDKRTMR